jgi:penicillin G amidase
MPGAATAVRDRAATIAGWLITAALLVRGLARPPPRRVSLQQRLAMLAAEGAPVQAPVSVCWNDHLVPWIDAGSDRDLAVALGVVHAHLRLGQMELMRRVARGRVAEALGPLGLEVDRQVRMLDLGRAVPAIVAGLAPETRAWADGFVAGVNHQLMRGPLPHEFRVLDLPRERWTLEDLFTVARLASADVSWLVFARLLRARRSLSPAAWRALWPRLLAGGGTPPPWTPRGGSNSCAVAGRRAARGAAMIASDPHLGLALPSFWLACGYRSPGHHAVGLMLAGFPFIALGRNPWLAWGGTSLHAASSELLDVSGLPLTERDEVVRVRGSGERRLRVRVSPLGPVVSDGALFRDARPLALRWVGHRPSDEMGAMLAASRARTAEAFRAALRSFAVPGQTMVYASAADGRVGRFTAAHLPRRALAPPPDLVLPAAAAWSLDDLADSEELPRRLDPPEGFIISANQRPEEPGGIPVGFLFSSGARARRMAALLGAEERVTEADLRALQEDVVQPAELELRDLILARARPLVRTRSGRRVLDILAGWDGGYGADSAGAVAFEAMLAALAYRLPGSAVLAAYAATWTPRALLAEAVRLASPAAMAAPMRRALRTAARTLRRYGAWGRMHRLRLAHHLAALPGVGRRYVFGVLPGKGGNDTIYKSGHTLTARRHFATYGAGARHISDLADLDANRFVILGGQDGWIGSPAFLDQAALWRAGGYLTVPLRPESACATFPHETVLRPPAGA